MKMAHQASKKYENGAPCITKYENGALCITKYENGAACITKYENGAPCITKYENDALCITKYENASHTDLTAELHFAASPIFGHQRDQQINAFKPLVTMAMIFLD